MVGRGGGNGCFLLRLLFFPFFLVRACKFFLRRVCGVFDSSSEKFIVCVCFLCMCDFLPMFFCFFGRNPLGYLRFSTVQRPTPRMLKTILIPVDV